MPIPLYVWLALIDTVLCLGIASFLLILGRRKTWDLSLLLYAIGAWASIPWVYYFFPVEASLWVAPYLFDVSLFLPAIITLFALRVTEKPLSHPALKIVVVVSAVFVALYHTQPNFILGTRLTENGVYPVPGLFFHIFTLYFGAASVVGLYSIVQAYRKADSWHKTRLQWIMLAVVSAQVGAGVYFYTVYSRTYSVPPAIFVIAAALILAFSIFKRRLYDIQLITRDAVTTGVCIILSTAPLILGRVFAPIVADLPAQSRLAAMMTLFATLSFFAIGVTLIRYNDHPSSPRLARFFFLASLLNAVFFVWAVPRNEFTVPMLRVSYFIGGCTVFAWIDYRESLLNSPLGKIGWVLAFWKTLTFGLLLIAASTPWVLKYLEYYRTTLRPYAVVPGPLHFYLHAWMILTPILISGFLEWRLLKTAGPRVKSQSALLLTSLLIGNASFLAFLIFGGGQISWAIPMLLEVIAAAGVLTHYLRQPLEGARPTSDSLLSVFFSTLVSCLAGFMLYYGLSFQMLACVLLALAMPKILTEFRGSALALVDQYVFRSKFSYLDEIERIGEDLFQGTHLPTLLARLAGELTERAELAWTGIWLFDLSEGRFLLRQGAGAKNTQLTPTEAYKLSFAAQDALPTQLKSEKGLILMSDLLLQAEDHRLTEDAIVSRALADMMRVDVAAAFPIHVGDGKLIGFLGFGHKIENPTFHQEDQDKLSRLGHKAENAIGQAYMLYEQSLMFSKLAQDTLDFLQALGMNIDILRNQYLGPLNEKQKRQLDIAAQQKEFIRSTLTDLRELERLMVLRMQGAWHMSRFDLKHVLEDALKASGQHILVQDIGVMTDLHDIPKLLGDGRSIRRAIDNLLTQAFNLTPAKQSVHIELYSKENAVQLRVTADGPGVEIDDVERLFDPFYKGRPGTPLAYGTGLGLLVVKEVMSLHLGRVWAENQPGRGIVFFLELPITE